MMPRVSSIVRLAVAATLIAAASSGCEIARRPAAPPALEAVTAPQVLERVREPGARATLVNVWATWCAPCREEFPDLVRLAGAHRSDGLRVLFVSADFDDQGDAVRKFLEKHGAPRPWLMKTGKDMEFINGLEPRWSGALPATIVYDDRGNVVEFWEGRADYARLEQAVTPLLAAASTTRQESSP